MIESPVLRVAAYTSREPSGDRAIAGRPELVHKETPAGGTTEKRVTGAGGSSCGRIKSHTVALTATKASRRLTATSAFARRLVASAGATIAGSFKRNCTTAMSMIR